MHMFTEDKGGWFGSGWSEMGMFLHQVWNKKIHYPPKVKGTQMANLHSGVAATQEWMLMAEKYHTS